jgi:hypothetical protein
MIKLKNILKEFDESPNTVFQKVAFGDPKYPYSDELSMLQHKRAGEPNTQKEDYFLRLLQRWVMSSTDDVAERMYDNYKLFKKSSRLYPGIFSPKTEVGTLLYRGLEYLNDQLWETIKDTEIHEWKDVEYDNGIYWIYTKPVEYIPERPVQSWTDVPEISENFSGDAVLITKQDNHFLFNKDAISVIFGYNESEILHFGKKFRNPVYLAINDSIYQHSIVGSKRPKIFSIADELF